MYDNIYIFIYDVHSCGQASPASPTTITRGKIYLPIMFMHLVVYRTMGTYIKYFGKGFPKPENVKEIPVKFTC